MVAYIDYNIVISIETGEYSTNDIAKINPSITLLPYSSAHIQEVDNIKSETEEKKNKLIDKKLQVISSFSSNIYMWQDTDTKEVRYDVYRPEHILKAIRDVPLAKPSINMFTNFISFKEKEEIRQHLGIESKEVNNYRPADVIEHLNGRLHADSDFTFMSLIDKAFEFHPDGNTFGLSHKIAAIYELLDMFGYWKDVETKKSNIARFWDSNHAYYASCCDYFITDDKRNRYKALVTYNLLGIQTVIVNSSGQVFN